MLELDECCSTGGTEAGEFLRQRSILPGLLLLLVAPRPAGDGVLLLTSSGENLDGVDAGLDEGAASDVVEDCSEAFG